MGCKKCGECCRWITLHGSWFDNDLRWLEDRGGIMHQGVAFFNVPCRHLKEDGTCGTYDNRPPYCGVIDDNPVHLSFFKCTQLQPEAPATEGEVPPLCVSLSDGIASRGSIH